MSEESLYKVLGVEKGAKQEEIRTAYKKLALVLHPDKNAAPNAHEQFQRLQRVYNVLSDPEKRKAYDQTGSLRDAEEFTSDEFKSLYEFIRSQLEEITDEKLDNYHNKYRGSKEEEKEMLELYTRFKGNMKTVFDYLPCSEPDLDSHRFMDSIDAAVEAGKVEAYRTYTKWKKKVEKKERCKDPLKPTRTSKAGTSAGPSSDLIAAIQKRKVSSMDPMISALQAKYGAKKGKRAKKT